MSSNFVPIYFGKELLCRLISHPLSHRIRRYLFRYYRKVIWNLLEIHYWLVSSMTSSQFLTRAMSENIGCVVVPQLLYLYFCHFVALGKCEYFAACSENCDPFKLHLSTGRLLEFTRNTRKLFLAPLHTLPAPKSGSR